MRRVEEEKKCTMETFKGQIQEAIKLELSQIASQHSAPPHPHLLSFNVFLFGLSLPFFF